MSVEHRDKSGCKLFCFISRYFTCQKISGGTQNNISFSSLILWHVVYHLNIRYLKSLLTTYKRRISSSCMVNPNKRIQYQCSIVWVYFRNKPSLNPISNIYIYTCIHPFGNRESGAKIMLMILLGNIFNYKTILWWIFWLLPQTSKQSQMEATKSKYPLYRSKLYIY